MNVAKKTVLLVEDDAMVRDIIRSAFEREYIVLEASGCSEAERMLKNTYDIALIDYMLPDGDGIGILNAVRQKDPKLPVIIMTAYSSEDIVIKALRAGATDYVRKPLVLANLRKKIANVFLERNKIEEYTEAPVSREGFLFDGIAAFIEENYSDDLAREDLAERIGMNKYKFSKAFNEKFGQSMKSYLNNVRVKKAAELLKNNRELSIADIAGAVGYNNIVHFGRVFKEIYGISPKEYRAYPADKSRQLAQLWDSE